MFRKYRGTVSAVKITKKRDLLLITCAAIFHSCLGSNPTIYMRHSKEVVITLYDMLVSADKCQ